MIIDQATVEKLFKKSHVIKIINLLGNNTLSAEQIHYSTLIPLSTVYKTINDGLKLGLIVPGKQERSAGNRKIKSFHSKIKNLKITYDLVEKR